MSAPTSDMDPSAIFDSAALRAHRRRAAPGFSAHDFLMREVTTRVVDRVGDTNREFPLAVEFGCHGDRLADALGKDGRVGQLVQCATLADYLPSAASANSLVADDEFVPFAAGSVDLALSVLNLHWVNDLPGTLVQIQRALKPDGLLLAAMLGGDTLHELRYALMQAEVAVEGGVTPRVSPLVDVASLGGLLQRAGFALPVVDVDTITVTYPDALALMRELRGMGETNATSSRRKTFSRRETLLTAVEAYQEEFADDAGRIPATFQMLYISAWRPHESQQQPAARGSATVSLSDALRSK